MNAVGSTRPVDGPPAPLPTQTAAAPPSLLSNPSAGADPGAGMELLAKLMADARERNLDAGKSQVETNKRQKEAEIAKSAQALKDQEDAKDSANTWGIIGKVASVVAIAVSAVAAVFTCGAASGLLVVSVALSAAAFAEQQFHVVGNLSGSETASTATSITLGVLSAICSFGATAVSTGASASVQAGATVAETAAKGAETAAQGASSIGMGITGCTVATSKVLAGTAGVAGGALQVVQGGVAMGGAAWNYAADEAAIDGKGAKQHAERMDRLTAWVIDGVKETSKSNERAMQSLQGAMQTKNQTLVMASSMRV